MGNSSYFRFDDDNKTKYIYFLNHHKGNGQTENTQPHMIMEDSKMSKIQYDLKARMHSAYDTPHKLCTISGN